MIVVRTQEAVRRYIEMICKGRDCRRCPIEDECYAYLGEDESPFGADFTKIERLFIAVGKGDNVDCND